MKTLAAPVASLALTRLPLSSARAVADGESDSLYAHAIKLMSQSPLIDTHVDLPQIIRGLGRRPLDVIPDLATKLPGHVDIPKMREGHLGGAFFTVWAPCADFMGQNYGKDSMKGQLPSSVIWEKRDDLPANWGGPE